MHKQTNTQANHHTRCACMMVIQRHHHTFTQRHTKTRTHKRTNTHRQQHTSSPSYKHTHAATYFHANTQILQHTNTPTHKCSNARLTERAKESEHDEQSLPDMGKSKGGKQHERLCHHHQTRFVTDMLDPCFTNHCKHDSLQIHQMENITK